MQKHLDKFKNLYKNNKQKMILFGSIVLVLLIFIITIVVVVKIIGFKITYDKLEEKLENATYKYLIEHPNELPNAAKPTVVINADILIENKYIKELKKYVKDSTCTANIIVDYESNNYKYQAYLTCNKFKTEKFIDVVKSNNKISQTGEGLYEMNNELVFRGQNPNNFILFADRLWRIVKVNKNGSINIIVTETKDDNDLYNIWDDRYNTEKESNIGINNFLLSRVFSNLKSFYDNNLKFQEQYLARYNLCVGKRLIDSTDKSGNLECNELIENEYIGLLPIYDYMNASLDGLCQITESYECQNYNYLTEFDDKWWTLTADMSDTYKVYSINYRGNIESEYASDSAFYRYVITLNRDVLYDGGNGTENEPYTVR